MTSDWIYYFGYGSLVNRDTRPTDEFAESARLKGWQRVWDHRIPGPGRHQQCTSLSIEPVNNRDCAGIDGVVARMPLSQLPELDARESGYERLMLSADEFDLPVDVSTDTVFVYRSLPKNQHLATAEHPILQSYVDCVLAGYNSQFGNEGMSAMVGSTRGWDRSILDDRSAPHYPRWVHVDPQLLVQIDSLVQSQSMR